MKSGGGNRRRFVDDGLRRDDFTEERVAELAREMLAGGYRPAWVRAHCAGQAERAIAFVANPEHRRYGGKVPLAEAVRTIATAEGRLGRCRDYLHNLILHLDELGLADGEMHRLYALVENHSDQA